MFVSCQKCHPTPPFRAGSWQSSSGGLSVQMLPKWKQHHSDHQLHISADSSSSWKHLVLWLFPFRNHREWNEQEYGGRLRLLRAINFPAVISMGALNHRGSHLEIQSKYELNKKGQNSLGYIITAKVVNLYTIWTTIKKPQPYLTGLNQAGRVLSLTERFEPRDKWFNPERVKFSSNVFNFQF